MRDKDTSKEFYLNIIEKNKAKIEKIESCINGAKERYLSILNKIYKGTVTDEDLNKSLKKIKEDKCT